MNDRVTTEEVESRLRRTLTARSEDLAVGSERASKSAPMVLSWDGSGQRPVWRERLVGAAAATAVVTAAALATTVLIDSGAGGRDGDPSVVSGPSDTATPTPADEGVAAGDPACGTELPFEPVGDDYSGPLPGPAEDRLPLMPQPLDGQSVVHWTTPTGAVEARWPDFPFDAYEAPPLEEFPLHASPEVPEEIMRSTAVLLFVDNLGGGSEPACEELLVVVIDESYEATLRHAERLFTELDDIADVSYVVGWGMEPWSAFAE